MGSGRAVLKIYMAVFIFMISVSISSSENHYFEFMIRVPNGLLTSVHLNCIFILMLWQIRQCLVICPYPNNWKSNFKFYVSYVPVFMYYDPCMS